MNTGFLIGAVAVGTAAVGTVASIIGAHTLFNKVIPRQDGVKVDMKEMADMEKWEEYKKGIIPRREYLCAQPTEHIVIRARDGITLHGDFFYADNSKKVAILFHGYTSNGMSCASYASYLHKHGVTCLLVDNRAHGQSEGKYIGFGILDRYDALKWIEYVNKRFGEDTPILLHGTSMGGSTVLMVAGMDECPENVRTVIADCAFTSPEDVFTHILKRDYKLPKVPIMNINNAICRKRAGYGFSDASTLDAVKKSKCPIFFVHGAEDNFVPTYMTKQNYEACTVPKDLLITENAGHGAAYFENPELYEKKTGEFLSKYFK